MSSWSESTRLDPAHPSLAGHFPDNPLAPGVLLLDRVMQALERGWPHCRVTGMGMGKFRRPWRPGQDLEIHLEATGQGVIAFTCLHEGEQVAQGQFSVACGEPAP
ncbi:MAG: beta-hydroxyacyl-ACP dehydratase [Halothiobacillaceae bacterium]|nr:MAG: beta-hydroxyacyl-ACP dehydratase [Halothiobacillaceae bacterium]